MNTNEVLASGSFSLGWMQTPHVLNEMERPKTGKAMESFLGFVNFLRDYVPKQFELRTL